MEGVPYRVHLQKEAQGLIPNPIAIERLLNTPVLPQAGERVWADFLELHKRREWREGSPCHFSWEALKAWQDVTGFYRDPWTLKTILAIEDAFFAAHLKSKGKESEE